MYVRLATRLASALQLTVAGALVLALLAHPAGGGASAWAASDPFAAMDVDRAGVPAPAPDVTFRSLEGQEVRLRGLRDKVVLLGFFTTT